ncbi:MAG: glutamate synthase-related protein [Anaerolineales bacterium]
MSIPPIRTDTPPHEPYGPEHDACAIYLSVRKRGEGTYGTLKRALGALGHMGHRTGFVDGEGDGAGVQTDIPRVIWAQRLVQAGLRSSLATDPRFWVGHVFIPLDADLQHISDQISRHMNGAGLNLLIQQPGLTHPNALGRLARQQAPTFWQIAGCALDYPDSAATEMALFRVMHEMEVELPIHFASLGCHSVVYKARGSVETLSRFYPDLQARNFDTGMALCHARFSTNTVSIFERVQPFHLLGHNGEFNTISRFRQEAMQIGALLDPGNSDSQDIDRALHTLCLEHGLDLIEAMELILPPVPHEVEHFSPALRGVYTKMRQAFGPYAQGPSAVIARMGDMVVASVDALGLRPLWFMETEKEFIFSSERGAIPLDNMVREPRALAPGEKVALKVIRGQAVEVFEHSHIRNHVMNWSFQREAPRLAERYWSGYEYNRPEVTFPPPDTTLGAGGAKTTAPPVGPTSPIGMVPGNAPANDPVLDPAPAVAAVADMPHFGAGRELDTAVFAATGWNREQMQELESLASVGKDLVGSLGYDGPLAVLSKNRVNLADFYKETVAVVTNPAIDRERESEAFSTRTLIGARPPISEAPNPNDLLVTLETPILPGGHPWLGGPEIAHDVAEALGTVTIEQLVMQFDAREAFALLSLGVYPDETVQSALQRLADHAVLAVREGAQLLLLDDSETLEEGYGWLDPLMAVSVIDNALRDAPNAPVNLRRRAGLVVRSASIRNLHDMMALYGFGADAMNPYAMLGVAIGAGKGSTTLITDPEELADTQRRVIRLLSKGLEKVTSTIGCHELRGYGRVMSSIGLAPDVAEVLEAPNYFGSNEVGWTWNRMNEEAAVRAAELRGESKASLARVDRFYPKFWKKAEAVALGELSLDEFIEIYRDLSEKVPVALRHTLGLKHVESDLTPDDVNIGIGDHDLPFLITAMSYGSQGELAYRAYAEAAAQLNMLCINGEGGELPDMLHKYTPNRGQQVASGRFGVNADFLNSGVVIEIKIGQGAKPGEGGMLPGYKVNAKVANARHTTPGVPLISPNNNHDIYSIEDLGQIIEELKTVNPYARVSVKIPVVPGVGVIAVGVAKAGADIIALTGYDGATGAARRHALHYVGLPSEIGVTQAHRALVNAGLRHRVELWVDGGMKTGLDAMKMILLGANRVGYATMAMVAMGCTICRKCHEGTCHVGITTHIETKEEADEKGLKSFVPREYDASVHGMINIFNALGEELRRLTAQLGATHLQDLVGRADLLEQILCKDMVDLSAMLVPAPARPRLASEPGVGRRLTRPRNNLTTMITNLMLAAVEDGEREVTYQDEVMAQDRALGAHLAGEIMRNKDVLADFDLLHLHFTPSAIGGNGFAAFTTEKMDMLVEGGSQDGTAKSMNAGRVAIMKGLNFSGTRLDGNVGKSFAYGAQGGLIIVQGGADSRACIRLSGADVVFGGEITERIDDSLGVSGTHANLKGFACEYMTSGRVLVMGDIGPYACAGMTGGIVYQHLSPELGYDTAAVQRRLAKGANVTIKPVEADDLPQIGELLGHYINALERTDQYDIADRIRALLQPSVLNRRFVKIMPILN